MGFGIDKPETECYYYRTLTEIEETPEDYSEFDDWLDEMESYLNGYDCPEDYKF